MNVHFDTLGLGCNATEREVKSAYAKLIKQFKPTSHPTEFAQIREAYEYVLEQVKLGGYASQTFLNSQEHLDADSQSRPFSNPSNPIDSQLVLSQLNESMPDYQPAHRQKSTQPIESSAILPKPETTEAELAAPVEDWERPAEVDIHALINQMDTFLMPQQEDMALRCFEQHMSVYDSMTLDQRADYEESFGYWLLHASQPSLQVLSAACQQFGWRAGRLNILKEADWDLEQRFSNLLRLASLYQEARAIKNPYLTPQQGQKLKWFGWLHRYDYLTSGQQKKQWAQQCDEFWLPSSQAYFSNMPSPRFNVSLVNIMFGLCVLAIAYAFHPDSSLVIALLCLLAVVIGMLPTLLQIGLLLIETTLDKRSKFFAKHVFYRYISSRLIFSILLGVITAGLVYLFTPKVNLFYPLIVSMPLILLVFEMYYDFIGKLERPLVTIAELTHGAVLAVEETIKHTFPDAGLIVSALLRVLFYSVLPLMVIKQLAETLLEKIQARWKAK